VSRSLVIDTAGLIALARLELLVTVGDQFGQLLVPRAVFDEATVGPVPGADAIRLAADQHTIQIVDPPTGQQERPGLALGAGEIATMELAAAVGGVAVLDDRDARRVARQRGLPLTGTLAILVRLRQLGAIGSLAETIARLDSIGFRTTSELRACALEAADESAPDR
jgi:predicted nucleic acid-binding protein